MNGINTYSPPPYVKYSTTEEVVVGEWIDGKPVYQKVFISDNVTSATQNKQKAYNCTIVIPEVLETVVDTSVFGYVKNTSNNNFYYLFIGAYPDTAMTTMMQGTQVGLSITNKSMWLIFKTGSSATDVLLKVTFILRYTKTT